MPAMFTELSDPNKAPASAEGTPVSVKIRERIVAAKQRFHANDNIAPFIEPGELEHANNDAECCRDDQSRGSEEAQ